MDEFLLGIYQSEVAMQCKFVLLAAEQLATVQRKHEDTMSQYMATGQRVREAAARVQSASDDYERASAAHELAQARAIREPERNRLREQLEMEAAHEHRWLALQSILVSAANISKLLWGTGSKREVERQALRNSLEVPDTSVLRDPELRNDFEHIDQRIEEWYAESKRHNFVNRSIGSPDSLRIEDEEPRTCFGNYDPATGIVIFWGHSVDIRAIVAEAEAILARATVLLRPPRPPPLDWTE